MARPKAKKTLGITPQKQVIPETPEISPHGMNRYAPLTAYGLGLESSTDVSMLTKLEMLRDPIIAWCTGFLSATLVRAKRVIECADAEKLAFFEAMYRAWESEFVLYSSLSLMLGSVGLVKKMEFEVPSQINPGDPPVWTSKATPYTCGGFKQLHPMNSYPRFDNDQDRFAGIDTDGRFVDRLYSLWITTNKARAFGNYLGSGRLENVYRPWWIKNFGSEQYAVWMQKNSDRVVEVSYPPGKNSDGVDNQTTALTIGDLVRSGATVVVPSLPYVETDPATGAERNSSIKRWAIRYLEGASDVGKWHEIEDHHNRIISLGCLIPPQAFLDVGGGQLGGPTTSDTLAQIAERTLMLDAADLDEHINKHVFRIVDRANFEPGTSPVRVRTVGLEKDDSAVLLDVVKALLGRQDIDVTIFDMREALTRLKMPVKSEKDVKKEQAAAKKEADDAAKAQADAAKAAAEAAAKAQGGVSNTPEEKAPGAGNAPGADGEQSPAPAGAEGLAASDAPDDKPVPIDPAVVRQIAKDARAKRGAGDEPGVTQDDIETVLSRLVEDYPELLQETGLSASDFLTSGAIEAGPGRGWWGPKSGGTHKPKVSPDAGIDVREMAQTLYDVAARQEPAITSAVTGVVADMNGEMHWLDKRLKTPASIEQNLA